MGMKLAMVLALLQVASLGWASDHSQNPDRFMSIGIDGSAGKTPNIFKNGHYFTPRITENTDLFTKGAIDLRLPVTNSVTLHAFGSATDLNNRFKFKDGHEIGAGVRIYIVR